MKTLIITTAALLLSGTATAATTDWEGYYFGVQASHGEGHSKDRSNANASEKSIRGFTGGVLGSRLYERSPRHLPILSGLATIAGVAPVAMLLNYPSQAGIADPSFLLPIVYGGAGGFLLAAAHSQAKRLRDLQLPQKRSQ